MPALDLLASPLAERLTWTLVHFLWQGTAVTGLLFVIVEVARLRRANVRYACSLAALLVMTACPLVTFVVLDGAAVGVADTNGEFVETAVSARGASGPHWEVIVARLQPWLFALWLKGVVLLAARLLVGLAQIRKLRQQVLPLPLALAEHVKALGRRLQIDALPRVFLSHRVGEALVVGLLRPLVLLPAAWAAEMPLEMLEAVVAHELAHIRRHDLWINLLQRLVETLLFYHPAIWWLSRRLRQEREMCCDELAVAATGRRVAYVTTLELVARWRLGDVRPALAASIRGEKNMKLLQRVRNVLGLSAADRARLWPVGALAIALPLGLWAASTALLSTADDREGDKPRTEAVKPRAEGERREGARDGDRPRAEGDRRDGDRPRAEGERREVARDGDKPRVEGDRREGDRPRAEGERREVARDGDRPRAEGERGHNDARIEKLSAIISKLTAEVRMLRAEVNELRGGKTRGVDAPRREVPLEDREAFERKVREAIEREADTRREVETRVRKAAEKEVKDKD
jgi:beta-lactamase regulating signal transducer with metallopeptidase domain